MNMNMNTFSAKYSRHILRSGGLRSPIAWCFLLIRCEDFPILDKKSLNHLNGPGLS